MAYEDGQRFNKYEIIKEKKTNFKKSVITK